MLDVNGCLSNIMENMLPDQIRLSPVNTQGLARGIQ